MNRRTFVTTLAAGGAAAAVGVSAACSTDKPTGSTPKVTNAVLVHGAYADGSCWADVIPLLQARGMTVTSVQNPLHTLDEDVAYAQRTLALMDGPTVLVGHRPAHPTPARTTPRWPRGFRRRRPAPGSSRVPTGTPS